MKISEEFKKLMDIDIKNLKDAISDINNVKTYECAKIELYKEVTAKYNTYVPELGKGLYSYYEESGFYDEVKGETLHHNLEQIYNKLIAFKAIGYVSLKYIPDSQSKIINNIKNNNSNQNNNLICISFNEARKQIENMSCLPDDEMEEIINKIDEIEKIVTLPEHKSKKWEKAKPIIKWIADKGADIGIALLPLILNIK